MIALFLISFLLHNDTFIKIDTHYSPFKFNRFFLIFSIHFKRQQIFYGRSNIKMLPHTTRNRTRLNIICTRNLNEEKRKLNENQTRLTNSSPKPSFSQSTFCILVTSRRILTTLHDFLTTRTLISILYQKRVLYECVYVYERV